MSDEPMDFMEMLNQGRSRPQHYAFAHQTLASMALREPDQLQAFLGGKNGLAWLHGLWHFVGDQHDSEEHLSSEGLTLERFDGDDGTLFVVRLPEPVAVSEAHMVAVVLRDAGTEVSSRFTTSYLTLEVGFSTGESGNTTLAEWRCEGSDMQHLNYGEGPEPEVLPFAREACARAGLAGVEALAQEREVQE